MDIPEITNFKNEQGKNRMDQIIRADYMQIKADIDDMIKRFFAASSS
nr:hypothetical protein [Bacteroidetes bacterium endosymbiont of Geopemphigus sp.]